MKTFNQVILMGYACRPELATDNKPLKFAVATEKAGYTKADGTIVPKEPQFHDCVCFGKLGLTISQFMQQGDAVLVEGELTYNQYTDKNGVNRISTTIIANNVHIIHHKQDSNGQPQRPVQQQFENVAPQPIQQQWNQQQYNNVQPTQQQYINVPQQQQQVQNSNNDIPF